MRPITQLILSLAVLVCLAFPARADEIQDMEICLGRQTLGRLLCKPADEINYVSRMRDGLYLFSAFYANRETHFFVGVDRSVIRIQGKEFKTVTRTIPYHFDATSKCAVVDYKTPGCPMTGPIVCCAVKTEEDRQEERFWNRPIPELLEEDLRRALQGVNATDNGQ
ncbi:hypothetical protein [Pseudodesulfovibrio pelocollis]|uniref:hypothetical protein n=1 Tax=Pseudodesulfovibrio pelocollis TaxID=3051432 RepID=UPI00255B0A69|nr:hypothetical protein [Pseudodesulfovibrio sp. SB368]